MESRIVGKLKPMVYDPDFFESESYSIPYFKNQKLKIGFVDAKHLEYLIKADEVLENFLKLNEEHKSKDSDLVFNYYQESLKFGYTNALDINAIDEVWNFVYPSEIIVDWDEKVDFYLNVSCECEWEKEHGLQLVFKDGLKLIRAGGHE